MAFSNFVFNSTEINLMDGIWCVSNELPKVKSTANPMLKTTFFSGTRKKTLKTLHWETCSYQRIKDNMKYISNEFRNEAVANRRASEYWIIRLKTAITTKCRNENNAAAAAAAAVECVCVHRQCCGQIEI